MILGYRDYYITFIYFSFIWKQYRHYRDLDYRHYRDLDYRHYRDYHTGVLGLAKNIPNNNYVWG